MNLNYNKNNQLVGTKIADVIIDDFSKPGDYKNLPVKTTDITTKIVYNAKSLKSANKTLLVNGLFMCITQKANLSLKLMH